jgi:flagellar basal-body rod protein FlgF
MSGGYYIALSGMRTQINQLDRLAEDLANSATAGFKSERTSYETANRPRFEDAMESAIDVTLGDRKLDTRPGNVTPTGRNLDVAVQRDGFLVIKTDQGERYTRNGHLMRTLDGTLTTQEGNAVLGDDGPIKLEQGGEIAIENDGTIRAGKEVAGKLSVVRFENPGVLLREGGALLRAPEGTTPIKVEDSALVKPGALEDSNVSVVERLSELTTVSRAFQSLQRALSVMMNDVDGRSIDSLGRR